MVAAHAHDIEAGQKHELQKQHFVNGQGLDLHWKNVQSDLAKNKMAPMKNGHLKVHTQSTLKYSYPLESFIIIMCALLIMPDIGRLPGNILKLKEMFSEDHSTWFKFYI